jgi:hypothetical protein
MFEMLMSVQNTINVGKVIYKCKAPILQLPEDLKDEPCILPIRCFHFGRPGLLSKYGIREIFHILLTMPIESIPCERPFSALRHQKQRNRTTMV